MLTNNNNGNRFCLFFQREEWLLFGIPVASSIWRYDNGVAMWSNCLYLLLYQIYLKNETKKETKKKAAKKLFVNQLVKPHSVLLFTVLPTVLPNSYKI